MKKELNRKIIKAIKKYEDYPFSAKEEHILYFEHLFKQFMEEIKSEN